MSRDLFANHNIFFSDSFTTYSQMGITSKKGTRLRSDERGLCACLLTPSESARLPLSSTTAGFADGE